MANAKTAGSRPTRAQGAAADADFDNESGQEGSSQEKGGDREPSAYALQIAKEIEEAGGLQALIDRAVAGRADSSASGLSSPTTASTASISASSGQSGDETTEIDFGSDIFLGSDGVRYGPGKKQVPNAEMTPGVPGSSVAVLLQKRVDAVRKANADRQRQHALEEKQLQREFRAAEARRDSADDDEEESGGGGTSGSEE